LADYGEYQEAYNFAQQTGAFEVRRSSNVTRGKVLRQVVLHSPIHWCPIILTQPVGVIGNYQWSVIYFRYLSNSVILSLVTLFFSKNTSANSIFMIFIHYV